MAPRETTPLMFGPNPLNAQQLSPAERIAEIAEILAAGLMRLRARKSSRLLPAGADFLVGTLAHQSGAVAEIEGGTP
jgi:hypothetical protein